eukprot:COSAG03_NODE_631_length_6620_cov_2.507898_4_plen_243_part_00
MRVRAGLMARCCCWLLAASSTSAQQPDFVSLVPFANCTALGKALCYQGSQQSIEAVVKLDPLACKPPHAALHSGNCSLYGFGEFEGFDPIFKKVQLYKKSGPPGGGGNGTAQAAELRRWNSSPNCEGDYAVLSTDVLNECTPYSIPAAASVLVVQLNSTAYGSYHYQGRKDCTGQRAFLTAFSVGSCSGDLGGYSQMRVFLHNSTRHCSPDCECCPCPPSHQGLCKGTCPSCGKGVCNCPAL